MDNEIRAHLEMQGKLTPQLRKILTHVNRVGYITVRAAMMDYQIGSLSRRICDLEDLGFTVTTETRKNPGTGQRYVRYFVKWPETVDQKVAA